jgi:hypothetical protein
MYQAEEGMTFAQWCDSEYNTDGFTCNPNTDWVEHPDWGFGCAEVSDVIEDNMIYYLSE